MTKSIVFAGVGGQGIILASNLLAEGLMRKGYDVKMSEIHGMAQRGGGVTTQIRYGEKVYSVCAGDGEVDVLVAFEKIEAIRNLRFLKKGGCLILNECEIPTLAILTGEETYPKGIVDYLRAELEKIIILNARELAEELGNVKTQNVVILGALIKTLGIDGIDWDEVLKDILPKQVLEVNKKAFSAGLNA